jgi:hypothetical protein
LDLRRPPAEGRVSHNDLRARALGVAHQPDTVPAAQEALTGGGYTWTDHDDDSKLVPLEEVQRANRRRMAF